MEVAVVNWSRNIVIGQVSALLILKNNLVKSQAAMEVDSNGLRVGTYFLLLGKSGLCEISLMLGQRKAWSAGFLSWSSVG